MEVQFRARRESTRLATSRSFQAGARFDQFEVDLVSGELRPPGVPPIRIQQLPLQVLRQLLEAEGRVATRDQLHAALWPDDTFVDFEHRVNTAIKKLRQALGDSYGNRPGFCSPGADQGISSKFVQQLRAARPD